MRKSINFNRVEVTYTLLRLSNEEYMRLYEYSLPVSVHHSFETLQDLQICINRYRFNLAKIYVVLCHLFGESSSLFDDWKGTFSFPVLLRIQKSEAVYSYLLNLSDWRGWLELRLYRISQTPVPNDQSGVMHQPWPLEFPQTEIDDFFFLFYFQMIKTSKDLPQPAPFYKSVGSNLILYGYLDGEYFESDFESDTQYHQALEALERRLPVAEQQLNVKRLLDQITDASQSLD